MVWELSEDVEAFASTAGDFLRSRPVEHTVLLTLVDTLRRRGLQAYGSGTPVFGWWRTGGGPIEGALLQTPPYPMLFSALPAGAVPAAVEAVADRPLPGVNMVAADAEAFVAGWQGDTGRVHMRTRLYRLAALTAPPTLPAGGARTAGPGDRELLLRWHEEFYEVIGEASPAGFGAVLDDRVGHGGVTLWEDDGVPVSMVTRSRPAAGMVRIQAVYTPPERRGRGYAGAATVVATAAALAEGATDVVLFTDLANPTSNALYQRLGYRPIEDRVVVEFT